ncbi:hypothetical protein O3G_MSEX001525 [Manduca sexta]|uniref:Uncharacterized protein n=1 Tax=Manduca sexta TaxID=7130 RepID=A0A921YLM2_MANSE|nr:hypothetical protein O3G_MSEX001525 [Manduca sexta]
MALFPAYAQDVTDIEIVEEGKTSEPSEVSPGREMILLASDSGTDDERPVRPALSRQNSHQEYFYWDTKLDCGNLRVSTLYYPGRPQ